MYACELFSTPLYDDRGWQGEEDAADKDACHYQLQLLQAQQPMILSRTVATAYASAPHLQTAA